ncbi:unnamed protein product [Brugia timori]|uniref:Uncharacterized protein n=1 Tax=Brugia timori TaxID=42155 RepID=A0A0R3R6N7_9BILA|nr:unnamed protein product [Brugia timori]
MAKIRNLDVHVFGSMYASIIYRISSRNVYETQMHSRILSTISVAK